MKAGDFHRTLAILHKVDAPGSAVLRARSLFRLGLFDRVLSECTRRPQSFYDVHETLQLLELEAASYLVLGDEARAFETLARQGALAKSGRERDLTLFALQSEVQLSFWAN